MTKTTNLGLGCMALSGMYGGSGDDAGAVALIQEAIERGVTLLDTGDFYGMGHNELLIGRAIAGRRDRVQLSVKFGALRGPDGSWLGIDGRPQAVKTFAAYSLRRLGVDAIDIYRPARLDPQVPIEDTIGAIADLVQQGHVKRIGLSEVGADTIRRAHAVHPIADLQIEYSLASRDPEDKVFPALDALGIGATLYGVLSRGLLAGSRLGDGDFRARLPRFTGDNAVRNAALVERIAALGARWSMTPAQLALAWARAKRPGFTPLVGARTREQLVEALGALERPLSREQLAELEAAVPRGAVAGTRYDAHQMKMLDSER